jgi:hypothetical protein
MPATLQILRRELVLLQRKKEIKKEGRISESMQMKCKMQKE